MKVVNAMMRRVGAKYLAAPLLADVRSADDILAKQTVDRFYRFHGVRIGLGVLGTLFSALGLYRSMTL